jgi:hypothetical protein
MASHRGRRPRVPSDRAVPSGKAPRDRTPAWAPMRTLYCTCLHGRLRSAGAGTAREPGNPVDSASEPCNRRAARWQRDCGSEAGMTRDRAVRR